MPSDIGDTRRIADIIGGGMKPQIRSGIESAGLKAWHCLFRSRTGAKALGDFKRHYPAPGIAVGQINCRTASQSDRRRLVADVEGSQSNAESRQGTPGIVTKIVTGRQIEGPPCGYSLVR